MDDFKDMDIFEKEKRFHEELNDFVSRFSMEYDLTYPQILGVLSLLKRQIEDEFMYGDEEENEDREWED